MGVYERPADVVGYTSVPLPQGEAAQLLRSGTNFFRHLTGYVPGFALKFLRDADPPPRP